MIYSALSIVWDEKDTLNRNIHRELTEMVLPHIGTMILDGFVFGELCETIWDRVSGEDIEYTGTWRINFSY